MSTLRIYYQTPEKQHKYLYDTQSDPQLMLDALNYFDLENETVEINEQIMDNIVEHLTRIVNVVSMDNLSESDLILIREYQNRFLSNIEKTLTNRNFSKSVQLAIHIVNIAQSIEDEDDQRLIRLSPYLQEWFEQKNLNTRIILELD